MRWTWKKYPGLYELRHGGKPYAHVLVQTHGQAGGKLAGYYWKTVDNFHPSHTSVDTPTMSLEKAKAWAKEFILACFEGGDRLEKARRS